MDVEVRGLGQTIVSRFEIHHVDEPGYGAFVMANSVEAEDWDLELPGYELFWRSFAVRLDGNRP